MAKKALITGITGQDGSYLAELLLGKGYDVHGVVRRASGPSTARLEHLSTDPHDPGTRLTLHHGDLADGAALQRLLERIVPDEVYNLAAQSHGRVAFDHPEHAVDIAATGALRLLEAVREACTTTGKRIRYYQAGTAEMFGASAPPQDEDTPFRPRSPFAAAKVAAHWYTHSYREAYDLFACNGILFNHESPRRGEAFVTRKITRAAGRISLGLQDSLYLGNLDARRDWGFAGDYVEAMWLMLQQPSPDDYVVATGEAHSVKDFLEAAFAQLGLDWQKHVKIDPRYFRPSEVDHLQGDSAKARRRLNWSPTVGFRDLVAMMVAHDLDLARQERSLRDAGHRIVARASA